VPLILFLMVPLILFLIVPLSLPLTVALLAGFYFPKLFSFFTHQIMSAALAAGQSALNIYGKRHA
jgi:hypothetical protein